MNYKPLGKTNVSVPPIIFGTSCLGNLYEALPWETKLAILKEIFDNMDGTVVLDSAGKYGAGLALEVIGDGLRELGISTDRVTISNKLGWLRVPLTTPEPTFEPGAWADLKNDAIQEISYDGMLKCWEQGCELLGGEYVPQVVSVHDPDEYLAAATTTTEKLKAFDNVVGAYRALSELKAQGVTQAIGVGSKDWRIIRDISKEIELDWVMLAVSFTIFNHPPELIDFISELMEGGISVINSAVFHAGFLTGGHYFDYRILDENKKEDKPYFIWREKFFALCREFDILPATACVQFGLSHPGVFSIALNTSNPKRVAQNIASVTAHIPNDFWLAMKDEGLIDKNYSHVG
jgi:D-threo-aldose 1-dehydrogenase